MSEENVEVVRAASRAWNADDMDAFRELFDPNVILRHIEVSVIYTVRNGKVREVEFFWATTKLEAAGLRE